MKRPPERLRIRYRNLNSLISETEAQPAEALGLRPPKSKSWSVDQLTAKKPQPVVDNDKSGGTDDSQIENGASTSGSQRSPFLSRILSTPILGGPRSSPPAAGDDDDSKATGSDSGWSTFGRRLLRTSQAQTGEFGSLRRRASGSKSASTSKSSKHRFPRTSAALTSSTAHPSSHTDSPVGTLSSSGSKTFLRIPILPL